PATPSKKQEKIDGKILVVDDNNLNIVVAKKALEELIDNIDTALSGQECLDKINNGEKYDLILMDIMMPEMSGETTFTKLREIEGFNTPVIAVTADTEAGSKEKYISEGFIDYVAKPFKKEEIKTYLEKYLNKKETEVKDEIETL
ncbi:MAG: response regulator, partial [Bacilli bacterium]|nr:response regulator [Bacilli bacterium]